MLLSSLTFLHPARRHSDITAMEVTSSDMLELGGLDLTNYFPM